MKMIELSTRPASRLLRPCPNCNVTTAWLRDDRTGAVTQITAEPVPGGAVVLTQRGTAYHPARGITLDDHIPRFDYHSRVCGPVYRPLPAPRLRDLPAD